MQFETRIIDGKPSIFFKDDVPKSNKKTVNTKNKHAKKDIQRSMEISGEVDSVKASQLNSKNTGKIKNISDALIQNGIKLSQEQLMALINQVQSNEPTQEQKISKNNQKKENNDYLEQQSTRPVNKSNLRRAQDQDFINVYRQPQIVVASDEEIDDNKQKSFSNEQLNSNNLNNRVSLVEKKKLKWQQDKDLIEKLSQQEVYDAQKFSYLPSAAQPTTTSLTRTSSLPRTGYTPEPPIGKNTMTLAEKKRLQWQQERDAQENLKKGSINDLSNHQRLNELNNQVSSQIRKSNSLTNLNQDASFGEPQRVSLIDKKKQKWNLDKENNTEHWPYGKPGVGAGRVNPQQDYRHKNFNDPMEEFNRIKEQIEAITATENKIKQEQIAEERTYQDHSKIPAAMRTSILFGGVMYDEDIKKTKEMERKKWLQDLEEQKKEKILETQRSQPNSNNQTNFYTSPIEQPKPFGEEKSFGRTKNLLDPAQIEELERKKKQGLLHKMEIDAQVAEKKRIKMLEEEIQTLNNMKIENEAKELKEANQIQQELKKQQTHYQNFEKILNSSRPSNTDVVPSVLQGENNKYDQETKTVRSNIAETRSTEIYRKMQEAELAAAEEKHKKLLKKLQKGGHDTSQLERKFAELKARLTGNPMPLINESPKITINSHPISNVPGLNFSGIDTSRVNNNTSQLSVASDHESKLERQRELLAKKVFGQKDSETNTENSKIQKIFQLLREDTTGLPAEITEEDLKNLLKRVVKTEDLPREKENQKYNKFKKEEKKIEEEFSNTGIGKDGKPIWNYKNLKGRKAVKNSEKDPFYQERAQKAEERKRQRLEYYKNFPQKNAQKFKESEKKQSDEKRDLYYQDEDLRDNNRGSVVSSMSNASTQIDRPLIDDRKPPKFAPNKPHTESILNLLTKNLAANPIYEEDEDLFLKNPKSNDNYDLKLDNNSYSSFSDNRGFVPFMRTNEVLDPVHAGSPVPPSRETSAIKRDREKARQAYIQNMKPSDYGFSYDDVSNRNKQKDPLLNSGLVRSNPTPRQEQILSQLASLKQSLIQKQKEIASSISYENNDNNYD